MQYRLGPMESFATLTLEILVVCFLLVAFSEVINGFHDTATAVATVIYTKSMPALPAVFLAGVGNFLGVLLGGSAIAFALVNLLPVGVVAGIDTTAEVALLLALLLATVIWNFGTWFLGLPVSTSHTLIGSIIGVGIAHTVLTGADFANDVNWGKAAEVIAALLLSPLLGGGLSMLLFTAARRFLPDSSAPPAAAGAVPPPSWMRALLIASCAGVSFVHGSNDGQKSIGLLMLVLIGMFPAIFAFSPTLGHDAVQRAALAAQRLPAALERVPHDDQGGRGLSEPTRAAARQAAVELSSVRTLAEVPAAKRLALRADILELKREAGRLAQTDALSTAQRAEIQADRQALGALVDHAATWVMFFSAVCLGLGTVIGWQRIVKTIGERIGSTPLNPTQGASAQLVAVGTIGLSDFAGVPVSTTHVLSSGVAGAMVAAGGSLQRDMVRNILVAWVTTLPATILLAMTLGFLFHHLFGG
ncbi:MAG: inorganic phosphate transporter [Nitrospirae bacterium]|nr:MAG: inorganic phosphate transporter [Nitrospirota bacterium]